jgi:arylsulfatase A-like enzyme
LYWPKGIGLKHKECNALVSSIDIAPTIMELASSEIPESFQGCSFVKLLNNPSKGFRNYVFGEHNWHDYEAHERMVRTGDYLYIRNSRPGLPNLGPADVLSGDTYREMLGMMKNGSLTPEQAGIFLVPRPTEELYEISADPDQFINISTVTSHREMLLKLSQVLDEWIEETGDNVPDSLTKDWYLREPGNKRTKDFNIRGEPVDLKNNAILNNNKGKF